MAGTSLLALIDDIATILDDVSVMTKVAVKKTSGVLGDDLALNAEQVTGVNADRELPVVLSVAKGSLINKVILVPMALAINTFIPILIGPLLMIGGAFLCFEGFEKIFEKIFPHKEHDTAPKEILSEESKIKGAVKTDFILSAEIIVITLGSLGETTLFKSFLVLSGISLIMTIGVYGLVGVIVKLDDIGLYLTKKKGKTKQQIGLALINSMPILMKFLGIAGTAAMFLVGGGIITHNIPFLHHLTETSGNLVGSMINAGAGVLTGGICFVVFEIFQKLKRQH